MNIISDCNSGIYQLRNLVNNKIYVGSAIDLYQREKSHFNKLNSGNGVNKHLQSSYNKYGRENFIFEVIEYVKDKNKLLEREQYWIDKLNVCNKNIGYNKRPKAESNLGLKMSDESKKKMSKAQKGKRHTEESKRKMSKAHLGRKASPETRLKLSESRKGKMTGEEHFMFGKHLSEESKQKMSKTKKAKNLVGEKHHNSKLSNDDVIKIKEMIKQGKAMSQIAKDYSVSPTAIKNIDYGISWTFLNDSKEINKEKVHKNSLRYRGENCFTAKLTEQDVKEIKKLFKTSSLTNKQIGLMYDVGESAISNIKLEKTWAYVKLEEEIKNEENTYLIGKIFGNLKVIEFAYIKDNDEIWKCLCNCGNYIYLSITKLNKEKIISCGCLNRELASNVLKGYDLNKIPSNNTSGFKGVCWNKDKKKWQAKIYKNKKNIHLGYFNNFEDAVKVRIEAEENYFGEYFNRPTNNIEEKELVNV